MTRRTTPCKCPGLLGLLPRHPCKYHAGYSIEPSVVAPARSYCSTSSDCQGMQTKDKLVLSLLVLTHEYGWYGQTQPRTNSFLQSSYISVAQTARDSEHAHMVVSPGAMLRCPVAKKRASCSFWLSLNGEPLITQKRKRAPLGQQSMFELPC